MRRFLALACGSLLAVTLAAIPALAASPTLTVTKTADTNDGACDSDCSLREAVVRANADNNASTIIVPAGHYSLAIKGTDEDVSATGDLDIRAGMTIDGAGARKTIIDAKSIDRVFHAPYTGTTVPFAVRLQDMAITGGYSPNAIGGGMWMQDPKGTYYLDHVAVRGNKSIQGAGVGNGYQFETVMYITNSTISGNKTLSGGQGAGIQNVGTLSISNSTIANNQAANVGGGAYNAQGTIDISWTTIAFNTAATGGGLFGTGISVRNSIVAKNNADSSTRNCGYPVTSGGRNIENGTSCNFNRGADLNANPLLDPAR